MASKTTAGKYVRVGSKKGPLVIGGAHKKMEEDASFTYVPLFKVAGPKDEVEDWLKENHSDQIKEAMKGSYSLTSLKSKAVREAFEREVEDAAEARIQASSTKQYESQIDLRILGTLLKKYEDQLRKDGGYAKINANVVDLKSKVKQLEDEDKVFDITHMKKKGTDGKKADFKEGGNRRRLSQIKGDPFYNVVYYPKNPQSIDGVRNFLSLYGGVDDETIRKNTQAVKEGEIINISRGKSPTRSPLLSPSRRRGKKGAQDADILDELMEEV